jgi:hypothetical protein
LSGPCPQQTTTKEKIKDMANIFTPLDIGGAPSDVSAQGEVKTIQVVGPFQGDLDIEAHCGGEWIVVAKFSTEGEKTIRAALQEVRVVNRTNGSPDVSISANDDGARFVELVVNGPTVDVSALGTFNTFIMNGTSGFVKIEISEDGADWTTLKTFQNKTIYSEEVVAKFMRAQGNGFTSVCVGAIDEASASLVITQLVYRPEATGDDAPGGNIYTDWAELYERFEASKVFGNVEILIDARFSTVIEPGGETVAMIPARPDPSNPGQFLQWDMDGSIIADWIGSPGIGQYLGFDDNCEIVTSGGSLHFHSYDGLILWHDGEVNSPILLDGEVNFTGGYSRVYNTVATALPMFKSLLGFMLLEAHAQPMFIGNSQGNEANGFDCPAPVFDNDGGFMAVPWHGAQACDSAFTGSGPLLMIIADEGPQGPWTWSFPLMTGPVWWRNQHNKHGGRWRSVAYDSPDVYTNDMTAVAHLEDYSAFHNDVVPVDTTGGTFVVTAPLASNAPGEIFTVKDFAGGCGGVPVTVAAQAGDTIESDAGPGQATAEVDNAFGSRTWQSDGIGNWLLIAQV